MSNFWKKKSLLNTVFFVLIEQDFDVYLVSFFKQHAKVIVLIAHNASL